MSISLVAPAPLLQSLDIVRNVDNDDPIDFIPDEIFLGQAPRLRDLKLSFLSISWNSPLLHNLTNLTLDQIQLDSDDDFGLFRCLATMPFLKTLKMCRCMFLGLDHEALFKQKFVKTKLPNLILFDIEDYVEMCAFYLRNLALPTIVETKIKVSCGFWSRNPRSPLSTVVNFVANQYRCREAKSKGKDVEIELIGSAGHRFIYRCDPHIILNVDYYNESLYKAGARILASMSDALRLDDIRIATFSGGVTPWLGMYEKIENVEVLEMERSYFALETLHALMKDLHDCPDGCPDTFTSGGILFPLLEILVIRDVEFSLFWYNDYPFRGYNFAEALRLCLETRYHEGFGISTLEIESEEELDEEMITPLADWVDKILVNNARWP